MNCKPGNLAIVIASFSEEGRVHIGKIVKISHLSGLFPDAWVTSPSLYSVTTGKPIHWQDSHLKPVSGLPIEEETEQKLKEPA